MILTEEAARDYVADKFGSAAVDRLASFLELLRVENGRQNLVAAATLETAWVRHVIDSLQLVTLAPDRESDIWLDLGTGAGFPGLAIALAELERPVVLVESRRRRCEWLDSVIAQFGLKSCTLRQSRLEAVETIEAGVISARAFAPLDKLLELSARFSTNDTVWVLPKGRSARQERDALPKRTSQMFHVEQSLTDPAATILVGTGRPELSR